MVGKPESEKFHRALVLQGGGALGAYEAGVLKEWCSREELINRAKRHLAQKTVHARSALYLTEAFLGTDLPMELQHKMGEKKRELLSNKEPGLISELSTSDMELLEESKLYAELKDYKKSMNTLEKIKDKEAVYYQVGYVYDVGYNDFKKAEEYYMKAIENGSISASINLVCLYLEHTVNIEKALELSRDSYKRSNHIRSRLILALTLIWNNAIEEVVVEHLREIFMADDMNNEYMKSIEQILMLLIAKKQYYLTLNYFNDIDLGLKVRFKPIYYALMYFMKDEYPNEYRKMGGELKETVEEIIQQIKEMAKDFD